LIHFRYRDRLTFSEVARRTGRSEAALRQQAGRALEKLGGLLQRRGVGVPVATVAAGLGTILTETSSASAAGAISSAAIASAATNGGSWIAWVTILTMSTKKNMLVIGLIATLIAVVGVWKIRETKGLAGSEAGSSTMLHQSGSFSSDTASGPAKTKVDRSRAVTPPSPEEVEAAWARQRTAVNYARQIGLGLFEFENEFGAFPNEETAAAVKQATGTTARLGAATANECFYQLIAANFVGVSTIFTWDEPREDKDPVGLENCSFSYLSGLTGEGPADRPLVVAPLVSGTGLFDRKALGGKAVVLRVDNSATTFAIEQDGRVILNGMDLFDPAQPFWQGKVPTIRWPEK
jgi:hypothetical protein